MASHKRHFPCGHIGHGKYCHRCKAAEAAAQERQQQSDERAAWQATFASDPVDLRLLPTNESVAEARSVIAAIRDGRHFAEFGGKRMSYDRNMISVPLGRDYRIMLRDDGGVFVPIEVMNHEAYNKKKPGMR